MPESKNTFALLLRLPIDMHSKLRELADRDHRNVSQEIRCMLEDALEAEMKLMPPAPAAPVVRQEGKAA